MERTELIGGPQFENCDMVNDVMADVSDIPFCVTVKTSSAGLRYPEGRDWRVRMEIGMSGGLMVGTELPFSRRRPQCFSFALPFEWASEIMRELQNLRVPAAPQSAIGCDGGYLELWTDGYGCKAHYRWWCVPPAGWEQLNGIARRILCMFDALRTNYDLRTDRRFPRLVMECSVAGMSHVTDVARRLERIEPGFELQLERERGNVHDSKAIAVCDDEGRRLGYIPRNVNSDLARMMDLGRGFRAVVTDVDGQGRHCPRLRIAVVHEKLLPEDVTRDYSGR